MGKKFLYGIENYVRDKLAQESAAGRTVAQRTTPRRLGLASAANGAPGGAVYIKPATVPKQVEAPTNTGTAAAVKKETVQPAVSTAAGTTSADTPMTQREMMYQNVVNAINSASQNLLDVMNRQFKYDEKSSPLYSILQKQYEREAEKAAGQAYAASVANTGGYGSSYATMAGEAARRQVMAGFDDQQLALYEAAKQEFDAERQSALDWYNTAVGMRAQAAQMVEEEKLLNSAKSSGMNEDTYNLMIQAANEGWYTGANKEALRARLNTIAAGNPEINVDAIMNQLTAETAAATTDAVNQFALKPTMSGAVDLMNAAKSAGTWDTVQPEVSRETATVVTDALKDPETAWSALDIPQETWAAYDDGQRKALVLDRAGVLSKEGVITEEDYKSILLGDVANVKEAIEEGEIDRPASEVCDMVTTWQNYRDRGYMSEEIYDALMAEAARELNAPELINQQAITLGEKAERWLDKKDMPKWLQKTAKAAVDVGTVAIGGIVGQNGIMDIGEVAGLVQSTILPHWDWYRKQLGLTSDQEKSMKELLSYYSRGGR